MSKKRPVIQPDSEESDGSDNLDKVAVWQETTNSVFYVWRVCLWSITLLIALVMFKYIIMHINWTEQNNCRGFCVYSNA